MTEKDIAQIIMLARRAPLRNMDEADAALALLDRFAAWAQGVLESENPQTPENLSAGGST